MILYNFGRDLIAGLYWLISEDLTGREVNIDSYIVAFSFLHYPHTLVYNHYYQCKSTTFLLSICENYSNKITPFSPNKPNPKTINFFIALNAQCISVNSFHVSCE